MRTKLSWLLLVCLLALIVAGLTLPRLLRMGGDSRTFLFPLGVLGVLLAVIAARIKTARWLKFFFMLTGFSAFGLPADLFLHDQLYKMWPAEPVTYVLLFYILPLTFVIGVLGAIITGLARLFSRSAKN